MRKNNQFVFAARIVISVALSVAVGTKAFADDFPGKGDRFAWSNALPFYNLANKYLEHGRYEEAVQKYEEAIYRYEYDPDFYLNYGVAFRKLENYSAAEQAFKKAIELKGNDWQAWSNLANAYLKQNRLKDTIACFQKAMKLKPPPPQQEKDAMLKDIADINKILSMQQAPTPAQAAAPAHSSAAVKEAKAATGQNGRGTTKTAQAIKDNQSNRTTKNEPAPTGETMLKGTGEKPDLKKSGWDWMQ